jgi:hypothetical protein
LWPNKINHVKHDAVDEGGVALGNMKLRTELQSETTLEAKTIDVSEMMGSYAEVHSVADNTMEEDKSH